MSISAINRRVSARYALAGAVCTVFSCVYEYFSHGVMSYWMICLALWPLLGGALPFYAASAAKLRIRPWSRAMWHCGIITLGAMSLLAGIMQIYGGAFEYILPMSAAGGLLLAAAVLKLLKQHVS